ncbi:hypothetical protein [Jiulongibacter sediminis]|uniref:hypothetical protein n=1 Tax=Jiulongibacter sediminis TaxID=1605367 RepID=UPI0026F01AA7|nr:hypothetical protein [Jiulongibacter sediminis]
MNYYRVIYKGEISKNTSGYALKNGLILRDPFKNSKQNFNELHLVYLRDGVQFTIVCPDLVRLLISDKLQISTENHGLKYSHTHQQNHPLFRESADLISYVIYDYMAFAHEPELKDYRAFMLGLGFSPEAEYETDDTALLSYFRERLYNSLANRLRKMGYEQQVDSLRLEVFQLAVSYKIYIPGNRRKNRKERVYPVAQIRFSCNLDLNEDFNLGQGVAHGFGNIVKLNNHELPLTYTASGP